VIFHDLDGVAVLEAEDRDAGLLCYLHDSTISCRQPSVSCGPGELLPMRFTESLDGVWGITVQSDFACTGRT
jgi:hypothetical protein